MGRRLCIVARDQALLWGYLATALRGDTQAGEYIDVVLDRREGQPPGDAPLLPAFERRRLDPEAEELLRTQGYVIVSLDRNESAPLHPVPPVEAPPAPVAEAPDPARSGLPDETAAPTGWRGLARWPDGPTLRRGAIWGAAVAACLAVVALGVHLVSRPLLPVHAPRSSHSPGGVVAREAVPDRPDGVPEPIRTAPTPPVPVNHVDVTEHPAEVQVRPPESRATAPERSATPAPVSPAPVPERAPNAGPAAPPKEKERVAAAATQRPEPKRPKTQAPARPVVRILNPFPELPWISLTTVAQSSAQGRRIAYTLSLRGRGGKPVAGAEASVHGRLPDGSPLDSRLEPIKPGTYRATVPLTSGEPSGLRVKVILDGRRYDIPAS